jgi:Siphovirus Gp157
MTTTTGEGLKPRTGSLYDHLGDIRALAYLLEELDALPEGDDEARETLAEWWAEVQGALADKIDRVLAYERELRGRAALRKEEADRLAALSKRDVRRADRLLAMVEDAMRTAELDRLETPRFRAAILGVGGARAVIVDDEKLIPPAFFAPPPARGALDKRALAAALEAEEAARALLEDGTDRPPAIPGARLAPRGTRLDIK